MNENLRDFMCEACAGSGREYEWSDVECEMCITGEVCPWCNGTGYEFHKVEPIDMEDLPP